MKQKIVEIGCPHCKEDCLTCDWKNYEQKENMNFELLFCLYAKFNGHTLVEVSGEDDEFILPVLALSYHDKNASLEVNTHYLKSREKYLWTKENRHEIVEQIQNEIQATREFLQGHIEWAKTVIKKAVK